MAMSKKMADHAKGWKTPYERSEDKRMKNMQSVKDAGKIASKAPPDSTKAKGKNSADSRGPGPNGWTKGMKKPKGC